MLRTQELSKTYRTGDKALQNVTLTVPKGQVMALIGPSGAGKSTLIRCINRLVEPTSGKVMARRHRRHRSQFRGAAQDAAQDGHDLPGIRPGRTPDGDGERAVGRLGYVGFWRSFTPQVSASSDVDEAFRLLDRVGLLAMADKRADELSGGQRQRVGIARALIQNPACCWSTSRPPRSIPRPARQIMRLICELCAERGLAAVINIHDVALAQMFVERIVGLGG
jgi:phosphonate transport system ATP-binding protein